MGDIFWAPIPVNWYEIRSEYGPDNPNNTSLANRKLASSSTQTYSSNASNHQQQSFTITGSKPETPPIPTTETSGFSLIEGYIRHKLSQSAETVILASWRKTTKSRHATVLKR